MAGVITLADSVIVRMVKVRLFSLLPFLYKYVFLLPFYLCLLYRWSLGSISMHLSELRTKWNYLKNNYYESSLHKICRT
jgi:hypothetical protein